jgi:hypothetical protein
MTPTLLLAVALQAAPVAAVPVTFSPEGTGWALISNASGTVAIADGHLDIHLEDLRISRSPNTTGTIKLTSYRVCLAYQKTETAWDMATCSEPKKLRLTVEPDSVQSIQDTDLEVSTSGLPPLDLFWLVIELESPLKGRGISHMYSRTRKDIFKVPASGALGDGR